MINRTISNQLFEKAKNYFPGGVNSPVRAFRSVGGTPLFMEKGEGCYIQDVDGNRFIDFCMSWGPLILGHANPVVVSSITEAVAKGTSFGAPTALENQLAELILSNHRFIEKIRFVSSGTEAAMSAIRLARGYTGRNKIVKFDGCYHGHVDSLLVKAGSGLVTLGDTSSAGVPDSFVKETIVLPLNNKEAVERAVEQYKGEIACIAIEPIPANNGLLLQDPEFLHFLREVCDREGILLFFDEVISGFRIGFEGAAGHYNIQPDVIAFGKIIGGGMPVGAYASSAKVMNHVSPEGPVYQAGTLSGNPVAMTAGIAQLSQCLRPGFYDELEIKTDIFCREISNYAERRGYAFSMPHVGSIFWIAFTKDKIQAAEQIDANSMSHFAKLHAALLDRGIYIGPSGYEVGFISDAHSDDALNVAVDAFCEALDVVFS
jgi:glutamate-1-semialdehyde 2,1-aminomutase